MEAEKHETPVSSRPAARGLALILLAAAALVMGARSAQLAWRGVAEARHAAAPAELPAPVASSEDELSPNDLALLAMACPASVETMPPELRSAFDRLAPPHRLTAARQAGGEWLVDPEQWYAPEDGLQEQAQPEPESSEPPAPEPLEDATVEPAPPVFTVPEPEPELPGPTAVAPEPVAPEPVAPEPVAPELEEPLYEAPVVEEPTAPAPVIVAPAVESGEADSADDGPQFDWPDTQRAPEDLAQDPPMLAPPTVDELQPVVPEALPAPKPAEPAAPSVPESSAAPVEAAPAEPPAPVVTKPLFEKPSGPEPVRPKPVASEPVAPEIVEPEPITPAEPLPGKTPKPPAPPQTNPPQPTPPWRTAPAGNQPLFGAPGSAPGAATPKPSPGLASPHATSSKPLTPAEQKKADESHLELFAKNCYPSAQECAACHKQQYEEWSVSSHAYAYVSPMFHKFEQTITTVSRGTVGYFCTRCHSPTAVAMNLPRDMPLWEMPQVAREGVTCIACHRVNEQYAKTNGERRIVPGDIYSPVYGGVGGAGVAKAIADKDTYKVKTSPDEKGAGQAIHTEGRFFKHLSQAEFCTSCHQVAVHPGIKLEVVWEQYRQSPACKKGVTCQKCHMGRVPGVASAYEVGPIAEMNGKNVNDFRQHANHTFYGPGYSIAHPGVFPFNKDANRWRVDEWLAFDYRAGWGTDDFEDAVDDGKLQVCFPEAWQEADDRYDAREIIEDNLKKLAAKRELRQQVMENGSKVRGPYFRSQPTRCRDLDFDYVVTNINEGHNLPTASLGAQPQLWANVVLIGPEGRRLWETGYTDSNGDLCDIHSEDVRNGRAPFDSQLFNLQTMFLITGATGTDREFFLPVNVSIDQLPQLRPGALPISVLNHPPFIRMESRSIAPLGSKRVKYSVPGHLLQRPGRYRLSFRMRSRVEPMYFMRFCDATIDMQRSMNEGILDVHPYSVEFEVK